MRYHWSLLDVADVEVIHDFDCVLGVNSPLEGLCGILSSLAQDDPATTRVFQHKLGEIVDLVLDDQPAVSHLAVLSHLLPTVAPRHPLLPEIIPITINPRLTGGRRLENLVKSKAIVWGESGNCIIYLEEMSLSFESIPSSI